MLKLRVLRTTWCAILMLTWIGSVVIVAIEDSPTFKAVATNAMGEGVDATPAIVGNLMFIRSAQHLFCIAE